MAKVIIPGNTQLLALVAIIVFIASHSDAIAEASHGAVMQDGLPVVAGVDHASVSAAFNQQLILVWNKNKRDAKKVKFVYQAAYRTIQHTEECIMSHPF